MKPQDDYHEYCTGGFNPDDVVITGMAGRFPECENIGELKNGIYNQKPLLFFDPSRFDKGPFELRFPSSGNLKNIDKFESDYFCLPHSIIKGMDPATRKIMEVTYESIADAGYDPSSLGGQKIGVYTSCVADENHLLQRFRGDCRNVAYEWIRSMKAHRICYHLNLIGPSMIIESACSSSLSAFAVAYRDIANGDADAAIVNATMMNFMPETAAIYQDAGILSPTGTIKPFDERANGIVRAEAVVSVFLQKASVARRAYATVVSVESLSSGYVPEGISVPSYKLQVFLCKSVLDRASLKPEDIGYIEAHGTGTTVGDGIELRSLDTVFCKNNKKSDPILIGSIKSNIGHTEAASGICGIVKALLALESGQIAPNYQLQKPVQLPSVASGKMKILQEITPLTKPYAIVNAFGLGGTLVQILLKQNPIPLKRKKITEKTLRRLILFCGTCESAVQFVFDYIKNNPDLPEEFFVLLNHLAYCKPSLKPYRGYLVCSNNSAETEILENINFSIGERRPIWFIFTGMGCQWQGMGTELMKIDVFAKSMMRSAAALKPLGFDLIAALHPDNADLAKERNIMPLVIGIISIQIALTDVLNYLGIFPDGILGHSAGETAASYADGCTTHEECILSAYHRGKAIDEGDLIRGAMAAVGLTWEEAKKLCPKSVFPACNNAENSVTISGPEDEVIEFVEELKKQNIFAKIVDCLGYCFHSKYVFRSAGIMEVHSDLIKNPKLRSKRWLSSCFLPEEWENPACKICNIDYFVHNLVSPVYFYEAAQKIPEDAILIEVSPHGLFQSILKKTVGPKSTVISLMKKSEPESVGFFMESIGKLYQEGLDPKIEKLYPPQKFPVPRDVPCISDLIKWNHTMSFDVKLWEPCSMELNHKYDLNGDDDYLLDHFIDGRALFPATGYLVFAWEMFAKKKSKTYYEMPVIFDNFKIHRATVISKKNLLSLTFNQLGGTGNFEIFEGTSLVASGQIRECKSLKFEEPEPVYNPDSESIVEGNELYDELKINGFEYGPVFRGLKEINIEGTKGLVRWQKKWIPFLDSCLLFFGLIKNSEEFQLPTGALSVKIDPTILLEKVTSDDKNSKDLPVTFKEHIQVCRSVGIEIKNLTTEIASRRKREDDSIIEEYRFVPYAYQYDLETEIDDELQKYMRTCNDILMEIEKSANVKNLPKFALRSDGVLNNTKNDLSDDVSCFIIKCLEKISQNKNCFKNKLKGFCSAEIKELGKDFINTAMTRGFVLNLMLDIIAENTFKKLNVTEIYNSKYALITSNIKAMAVKNSYLRLKNYSIVLDDNINSNDIIADKNVQVYRTSQLANLSAEKSDVVVGSFVIGSLNNLNQLIETLSSIVHEDGFILLYHKENISPIEKLLLELCGEVMNTQPRHVLEELFRKNKLVSVSSVSNNYGTVAYLLRPTNTRTKHKVLNISKNNSFDWIKDLKKMLAESIDETIWVISDDDVNSGITGMVNCLKQEPGRENIRCVFLSPRKGEEKPPPFNFEIPFYKFLKSKNLLHNVWRNGCWGSFRHITLTERKKPKLLENSYVTCKKCGDLSSFEWVESQVKYAKTDNQQLIQVYYSAINFKDIMYATGKLTGSGPNGLGLEFSGRDESGRRVAGYVAEHGMATSVLANPEMVLEVPEHWSLEEAASIPVVYSTCYYALVMRCNLRKKQSILIHSGTGGIGLAAINIALSYDCEIFVTVGNDFKKKYLRKLFPQIKQENIGCSRNTDFENMIKSRTNGRGVDVVLNSLSDDKLQASIRCVAPNGHFVEIGKYDMSQDRNLGMKVFLKNISFHSAQLNELFGETAYNREQQQLIKNLLQQNIKNGVIKPLERTVFNKNEVEQAFRYMALGEHVGKIVLKIREEEPGIIVPPKSLAVQATPTTYFYPSKVYIVIGGLGGFGLEVAKWIFRKGGRNIILTTRSGITTPYQKLCLSRFKNASANVKVQLLDVSKKDEAKALITKANLIGPVGGIFNSALVLSDGFMDNQSVESFAKVCAPKAIASKFLDELTRKLCPQLDFFICFSSISGGRGNAGQTNYGYANSVMERICEERRNDGLHGLSIQWGLIGDVGVVHRNMGDDAMIAGLRAQKLNSCLEMLDLFCQSPYAVVASYATSVKTKTAKPQNTILDQVMKLLGMKQISETVANRTFGEMGMDSLLAVEVKQLVETHLDTPLTVQELLELKLNDLKEDSTKSSGNAKEIVDKTPIISKSLKLPSSFWHSDAVISLNTVEKGTPVFIVNSGCVDISHFNELSLRIGVPLYLLTRTKSTTLTNMDEFVSSNLESIYSKVTGPFHLIGYSLGACLAFNLALRDEISKKHLKSLTLFNGSQSLLRISNNPSYSEEAEVTSLCDFVEQFTSEALLEIKENLQNAQSLSERVKFIVNLIQQSSSQKVSTTELMEAISDHLKLSQLLSHTPSKKLSKDILLIEDPLKTLPNNISEIKSSMKQLCSGNISIQRVISLKDLGDKELVGKFIELLAGIL